MKHMKKITVITMLFLIFSLFGLYGCGNPEKAETAEPAGGNSPSAEIPEENNAGEQPDSPGTPEETTEPGSPDENYKPSEEIRTEDDGNVLVLVNKKYTVSKNYYPKDMVEIDGSLSTNQNLMVKREAYDAYLKMLKAAQAEGLNFSICSAYRSYALQESLYNNSLAANGKEYTETMFAYPGKSEHHTGYAIDITSASMNWGLSQDFADYPDGAWITEHCSEYGFILRYPKGKEDITGYIYEPWHIRYVGVEIAQYITKHQLTLEEYLNAA